MYLLTLFVWLIEHCIFALLWLATFQLVWKCCWQVLEHYSYSPQTRPIVCSITNIIILFELLLQYQNEQAARLTALSRGPPLSCTGYGWLDSLRTFWSTSDPCQQYYQSVSVSILWKLNPLRVCLSVILSVLGQTVATLASISATAIALFLERIPGIYQLPLLFLATLLILCAMPLMAGYEFSILWNMLVARPSQREVMQSNEPPKAILQQSRMSRAVKLVTESLQKSATTSHAV